MMPNNCHLFFCFSPSRFYESMGGHGLKRDIMITANIRKQGNSAVMTIPADILEKVNIRIGATVEIRPAEDGFLFV